MFDLEGKIALVTGGAGGIGLATVNILLKNGIKGVVVVDLNPDGLKIIDELKNEFGSQRVAFVKADISDKASFEDAFKKTIELYNHIDILVNNAGILDDVQYEKEIAINLVGTTHGCLLALQKYLLNNRSTSEAVIINVSSIAGLVPSAPVPIYSATKFGIVGLTLGLGADENYQKTKIRVAVVCPGATTTNLTGDLKNRFLSSEHEAKAVKLMENVKVQSPDVVAAAILKVIKEGESGSIWISTGEAPAIEYKRDGSLKKLLSAASK